jgi:electron transfer flavoprotein alpha subunit
MKDEIWVWAEHEHDEVREVSLELLGEARRLAKAIDGKVCALILGDAISGLTANLVAYGADVVYAFEDPRLKAYGADLYLHAFSRLAGEHSPLIVLIAATPDGAGAAPRLAARMSWGYAANTTKIAVQPDRSLQVNRSTCLDKAHAVLSFAPDCTVVATIKPGSIGLERPARSRSGEIVQQALGAAPPSRTLVQGVVKADPKVVGLDEAERVVAAGCGFRAKEDLDLVWKLSEALSAAVGGSKPMFDRGWLPHNRLVGQSSGRRLSSRLFVAAGISGTSYFVEGMRDSRLIMAINSDKGAPLMKLADLAVCGDLYEILPELTRQLGERRKGAQ